MITQPGPPDVLQVQDVPDATAGPGEVLIEVAAAGVNRADLLQRTGNYPVPPGASPYPGMECSGRIAALGEGVVGWTVGQEVCALLTGGGYAELVAVPAGQLMPVPAGVPLVDAAALPEVTCTVWSMVFDRGRLEPGEVFLMHGGASGIGTMAIQLAHRHGARVFVTVGSTRKADFCRELGAELAINYHDEDFGAAVRAHSHGADVILDIMGASYLARNVAALARDGRLVVLGLQGGVKAEVNLGEIMTRRLTVTGATLRARTDEEKAGIVSSTVAFAWPAIASGEVRPVIDRVLRLDDAAEAHRLVDASEHIGKVLLQVR